MVVGGSLYVSQNTSFLRKILTEKKGGDQNVFEYSLTYAIF